MDTTPGQNENDSVRQVQVAGGAVMLEGSLNLPEAAHGLVLCAFSGTDDQSAMRSGYDAVIEALQHDGVGTLFVNLLTPEEVELDRQTRFFRFNVDILSQRILGAVNWFIVNYETMPRSYKIGYFASGPDAGAALIAAAERPDAVVAVVSCAGRPDLAESYLARVEAPTLFILGEKDASAVEVHRTEMVRLKTAQLETIAGVADPFESKDAIARVIPPVREWFGRLLAPTKGG